MLCSDNTTSFNRQSVVMYVDMNSFFASCEQQLRPELRGKPIGVCTYDSPQACVIAPSVEAKKYGVRTGMRFNECRALCPEIIPVTARPVAYRKFHIAIMDVLRYYCPEVMAKSIDEAALNLTHYNLVYKDVMELGRQIKTDIARATEKMSGQEGQFVKCSIGIAPNTFLAKLATEIQKPDGLIRITPENIDDHLSRMKLTDLPGIARSNERRLRTVGIHSPLEMRRASQMMLRKAFGGIVGHYWHSRLHFGEVDHYAHNYRAMSAGRTVSPQQRSSYEALDALLISLCTRLEQRLVKQRVFCRQVAFCIRYKNGTAWDTRVQFPSPLQDAMELRQYLVHEMKTYEAAHRVGSLMNDQVKHIGIVVMDFLRDSFIQYSLFDDRSKKDELRRVLYAIKDRYGKYKVRKGSELVMRSEMKDAIGFGSVKDLYTAEDGNGHDLNQYLLEEMDE
jgi:DNA polymerase-4